MADMEKLQTYVVVCEGGLDSNKNHIALAQNTPGAAISLINYEPSLFGGYRKIDGYVPLEEDYELVDDAGSEGRIYIVHIFGSTIITARKTKLSSVYQYFYWTTGADWTPYTTGLTLTSTNVTKIRAVSYNLQGPESVIFVDGVNGAVLFDGTNWAEMTDSATGADFANAGGNQVLPAPQYVTTFKNHLFISGDPANPQIVAHSAPNADYDWTAANGAGQINVGFTVKQIKPFRDALYVFGATKIKKIVVSGTDFVIEDVTNNGGLLAQDSVVEINGDLLFLAADGFRTVAATEKQFDVELGVVSKKIQQDVTDLIANADFNNLNAVVIRRKSQVRFFFSDELVLPERNRGILGALKGDPGSAFWEWASLKGIRTACTTSGYIGNQEYVLHGDYNGGIYRQEEGPSFNGASIEALYSTPFLDLGDVFKRKTVHKIIVFVRPEAEISISASLKFDWGDRTVSNPSPYPLEALTDGSLYNQANYNQAFYASSPVPFLIKNVEGSFFSNNVTFSSDDALGSFSVQAIAYEYSINGRK